MAKHTQRNIAFGVFGLIIVGAGTFLFLGGIPSGEFEFELPVQARLLTSQELQGFEAIEAPFGASVATGITCTFHQRRRDRPCARRAGRENRPRHPRWYGPARNSASGLRHRPGTRRSHPRRSLAVRRPDCFG